MGRLPVPHGYHNANHVDHLHRRLGHALTTARYVRLPLFEQLTGYTQKAVRRKIEEGIWVEGKQFKRAPDGHILIDMQGYERWVEGQKQTV